MQSIGSPRSRRICPSRNGTVGPSPRESFKGSFNEFEANAVLCTSLLSTVGLRRLKTDTCARREDHRVAADLRTEGNEVATDAEYLRV
jgi:hypothetical protein